jgi:uncharacterized protein (TIGR01244 family)
MPPQSWTLGLPGFSRSAATVLAFLATSLALAQSADLPNRHDEVKGITTAGQPSAEALSAVAAAGYKSVIDLRAPQEDRGLDEQKTVETLGMSYVNLPVAGADGVTYENAKALDRLLADLPKPVLVHCTSSNRVGALLALRAKLNGTDSEAALDLGLANGLAGLKPVVEKKLAEGHD